MSEWVAYCAPGTKPLTALSLMLRGENVTEIAEHPWLAGSTDVILVNQGILEIPLEFEFAPVMPKCPLCLRVTGHWPWCSLLPPPPSLRSAFIVTGI